MKKTADHIITIAGLLLLGLGLFWVKTANATSGLMRVLPYLSIGIGCGAFGQGMGKIVSSRAIHSDPVLEKQIEIESKDERNIAIAAMAKARAYDIMTYLFGALLIAFALMGVQMEAVLLLAFAYLTVQGTAIYQSNRLSKEM